jgi:hypothetical protein
MPPKSLDGAKPDEIRDKTIVADGNKFDAFSGWHIKTVSIQLWFCSHFFELPVLNPQRREKQKAEKEETQQALSQDAQESVLNLYIGYGTTFRCHNHS